MFIDQVVSPARPFLVNSICILLVADFLSGLFHWMQDAYGDPELKFLGLGQRIIARNLLHHKFPREFLAGSYWHRVRTSMILGVILGTMVSLLSWLFLGKVYWQPLACLLYASQANEIHAMSHRTRIENGALISFLQRLGLIQSRRHHAWHHKAPYDCHYCIMTDWLNPVLDFCRFWPLLELALWRIFSLRSLRGSAERQGL